MLLILCTLLSAIICSPGWQLLPFIPSMARLLGLNDMLFQRRCSNYIITPAQPPSYHSDMGCGCVPIYFKTPRRPAPGYSFKLLCLVWSSGVIFWCFYLRGSLSVRTRPESNICLQHPDSFLWKYLTPVLIAQIGCHSALDLLLVVQYFCCCKAAGSTPPCRPGVNRHSGILVPGSGANTTRFSNGGVKSDPEQAVCWLKAGFACTSQSETFWLCAHVIRSRLCLLCTNPWGAALFEMFLQDAFFNVAGNEPSFTSCVPKLHASSGFDFRLTWSHHTAGVWLRGSTVVILSHAVYLPLLCILSFSLVLAAFRRSTAQIRPLDLPLFTQQALSKKPHYLLDAILAKPLESFKRNFYLMTFQLL